MFTPDVSFKGDLVFDIGKIMEFNEGFYDILTSTFCEKLKSLPVFGVYKVVTERFRPDLISYRIYGDEQYKLILMMYNGLVSHKEIIPGIELIYPSLSSIESILFDESVR